MMVLGVDIGSGSIKASVAVVEKDNSIRVLYDAEEELMLKFDLELNGRITEGMQKRLHDVLLGFKQEAERKYGALQAFGVATAAMRAAPNGLEILKRLERVLSFNSLRIISQKEEGRLGFDTGVAISSIPKEKLLCLDSGGGSFQVSFHDSAGLFHVFEGPWGSISAATAILKVQGRVWAYGVSPNPVSLSQCLEAKAAIKSSLVQNPALAAKLNDPSTDIVAIGGATSMFRMIQLALGGDNEQRRSFSCADVDVALQKLVDKSDLELAELGFPQTQVLLSKLILFTAISEALLDRRAISYYFSNGSAPGIILDAVGVMSAL